MKMLLILFLAVNIFGDTLHIAELKSVNSNDIQKFRIGMYGFICQPYGVVTLEEVLAQNDITPVCRQKIQTYFIKYPLQKYFVQMHTNVRQSYHVEFKKSRCIVYAQGKKTLSEELLERGLGVMKNNFTDDEFRYLFLTAQKRAQVAKMGVWGEDALLPCIPERLKI